MLLTPFPEDAYEQAWQWLTEEPAANFDDDGPQNLEEFSRAMRERAAVERTWLVIDYDGAPCGIVAYLPLTARLGTFHGICFARRVQGTGIARASVRAIVAELFAEGVEKISASFFADNLRVGRFLEALGAVDEGLLKQHTVRTGARIDMRLVAIFKKE